MPIWADPLERLVADLEAAIPKEERRDFGQAFRQAFLLCQRSTDLILYGKSDADREEGSRLAAKCMELLRNSRPAPGRINGGIDGC